VAGAELADGAGAGAEVAGAELADGAGAGAEVAGAELADGAGAGAEVAGAELADGAGAGAEVAGAELADGAGAAADTTADTADVTGATADATGAGTAGAGTAGAELTGGAGAAGGAKVAACACRENTSKTARIPAAAIATCIARRAMCRKIGCGMCSSHHRDRPDRAPSAPHQRPETRRRAFISGLFAEGHPESDICVRTEQKCPDCSATTVQY
jgi:hypothetical protein